jgi:hypothetical protein
MDRDSKNISSNNNMRKSIIESYIIDAKSPFSLSDNFKPILTKLKKQGFKIYYSKKLCSYYTDNLSPIWKDKI